MTEHNDATLSDPTTKMKIDNDEGKVNSMPKEEDGKECCKNPLRHCVWFMRRYIHRIPRSGKAKDNKKDILCYVKEIRSWLTFFGVAAAALISFKQTAVFKEQLLVSRDQEIRQLRAYVFVRDKTIPKISEGKKVIVEFVPEIVGQTPVYNLTHVAKVAVKPFPLPPTEPLDDFPERRPYYISVAPGRSTPRFEAETDDVLSKADIDRIAPGGGHSLYVYGRMFYEDAFAIKRCMRFCFMYRIDTNARVSPSIYCNRPGESGPEDDGDCTQQTDAKFPRRTEHAP